METSLQRWEAEPAMASLFWAMGEIGDILWNKKWDIPIEISYVINRSNAFLWCNILTPCGGKSYNEMRQFEPLG